MKKFVIFIFVCSLVCLISNPSTLYAASGVAINSSNFPDSTFRSKVNNFDSNRDGYLSQDEAKNVTSIDVSQLRLSSLKGIEYFTELTSLDCSYNYITELDLSKNTKLVKVRADNNKYTSLDASALTELQELNTGGYSCQTVNVKNCTKLESFAAGAAITEIDLSNNKSLKSLTIGGSLNSLDLSNNTKLRSLYLGTKNLKVIDVRYCTDLKSLTASGAENLDLIIINKNATLVDKYDGVNLHITAWHYETIMRDGENYSNEWVDGLWYDSDGSQNYTGTMSWKHDYYGWWIEDTDGWYPVSSWQRIDHRWYYFDSYGYMCMKEYRDGYYLSDDGAWRYNGGFYWKHETDGWKYVSDGKNGNPGVKLINGWYKIDGYWYYFDSKGYILTDQYVDGYWLDSNGVCQ